MMTDTHKAPAPAGPIALKNDIIELAECVAFQNNSAK
jgi:hypothetical protein